jgi:hypothetical protein
MTENDDGDLSEIRSERNRLLGEVARLTVSKETGVPPGMLGSASTLDEARALAAEAVEWRGEGAQGIPHPPRTSAVASTPNYLAGQISRDTLTSLSPEQRMQAAREGRLVGLGVGVPQQDIGPIRNGRPHV